MAYNFVSNRNSLVKEAGNHVLQLDFPKGCLGKECALAARVDLDAVVADMGMPPLEEATLQYKYVPCQVVRTGKLLFTSRIQFLTHHGIVQENE